MGPDGPSLPHEDARLGSDADVEARWRSVLTGDARHAPGLARLRRIFRHLPSDSRCKLCYAPYGPPFGPVVSYLGFGHWSKNPSLCGSCLRIMERSRGGAEIELSMLFADLRQSTEISATMSAGAFGRTLTAFYAIASRAVEARGGSVDKYLGDGVFALFIPGFTGPEHATRAIEAAIRIQHEMSQPLRFAGTTAALAVGIGVHTGTAYVGVVGRAGDLTDFTALGAAVNVAARLSSVAHAGEVLISDSAMTASTVPREGLQRRELELKGVAGVVSAWSASLPPAVVASGQGTP